MSKTRAVWLGHMKTVLWLGEDGMSTETGALVAKSTLQLFELATHILAAQSFWGRIVWVTEGMGPSLCYWTVTNGLPITRMGLCLCSIQVFTCFIVLLTWACFSSFIWKNLWQEELLNCSLSWHKVNSVWLGRFCSNCSCVRQCPLVLLHLCFQSFSDLPWVLFRHILLLKGQMLGFKRTHPGVGESEALLLEEKTPQAGSWLIVDSPPIHPSFFPSAVILWNHIGFHSWVYLKFP